MAAQVWQRTAACKAKYCDLFEPIEGCIVIDEETDLNLLRPSLAKIPTSFIPASYWTHPSVLGTPAETEIWKSLKPLPALRALVESKREYHVAL